MRLVPHKLAYAHRDLSLIHCQNPQWINDTLLGNATLLSWDAEVQTPSGIDNWTFIAGEYTLSWAPRKFWQPCTDSLIDRLARNLRADVTLRETYLRNKIIRGRKSRYGRIAILNFFNQSKTATLQIHTWKNYAVFVMVITQQNPDFYPYIRKFFYTVQSPA